MKKNLLRCFSFVIFLGTFIHSNQVFSQQASTLHELVLEIPTITTKNYSEIKNALVAIDGLNLVAYCEDYKCFLIYYDTTKIESEDAIEKVIEQLNPSYKVKKRLYTKFSEIIGACNVFPANNIDTTK